jgi:hypothetical protein
MVPQWAWCVSAVSEVVLAVAPAAERQWLVGRCWVDGSSWCAVLVCCASLITYYYSCCLRVWNSVQPPHPHDPVSVPTATAGVDSGHSATDPISGGTSSGFGSRAVVVVMVTARVCVCMCVCVRARVRACACLCRNAVRFVRPVHVATGPPAVSCGVVVAASCIIRCRYCSTAIDTAPVAIRAF